MHNKSGIRIKKIFPIVKTVKSIHKFLNYCFLSSVKAFEHLAIVGDDAQIELVI